MDTEKKESILGGIMILVVCCVFLFGGIGGCMWGYPKYRIYRQDLRGQAELREAEWTRKIAIEEAKAKKESATMLAEAEVERAKGVAQANEIIGDSLADNEAYLRYLWIQGLHDGTSEVIYVPTEANLPILEATRGLQSPAAEVQ